MIISTFVRYATIQDLIKRLHDDIASKIHGRFLVSDSIRSEVSYSALSQN